MRCVASREVHIQNTLRRQVPGVRKMGAAATYDVVLRNGLVLGRIWLHVASYASFCSQGAVPCWHNSIYSGLQSFQLSEPLALRFVAAISEPAARAIQMSILSAFWKNGRTQRNARVSQCG